MDGIRLWLTLGLRIDICEVICSEQFVKFVQPGSEIYGECGA